MKRIYQAQSLINVAHVRNLLTAAGIKAHLRNEFLAGAMGDLPMMETWPQLWVDEIDEPRALQALAGGSAAVPGDAWVCTGCKEVLEPQFLSCWRCGTEHSQI